MPERVGILQNLNLYVAWVDGKNDEPDLVDTMTDELEAVIEQPWVEEPPTPTANNTPPNSPSICPTELDSPSSDLGSDVDFEPSETEEPRPCVAQPDRAFLPEMVPHKRPVVITPPLKRLRRTTKSPPPTLIPDGYVAMCPRSSLSCRAGRELDATVLCVNWGARKSKPLFIRPLHFQGFPAPSTAQPLPSQFFLIGKEDGHTYYSSSHISSSPSAQAIFTASATFQQAYSRLPLLLSPSRSVPLPTNFKATVTPDIFHNKTCATDGQSEVSPQVGWEIGLLPATVTPERPGLYSPWQFRAFLLTIVHEGTLSKGMLLVDPMLEKGMALRESCVKLTWDPRASPARQSLPSFQNTICTI